MSSTAPPAPLTYRDALRAGIRDALRRDQRVFLMGEDVGPYGGAFGVSRGLLDEFGPERIRDTPLSEAAFVGAGIGAALGGMRPIVEVMTVNFSLLALDQIVNNAATIPHMSGGQFQVPLVIRMCSGAGRQLAAQHSHSLEGWYAHVPGLKVLTPATLDDAQGMLWPALEDPNPVVIFEHGSLYNMPGELADDAGPVDIEHAAVRRPGTDVSLITYGASVWTALQAADALAEQGVEAEVLDLRVLRPLDEAAVLASVARTHRAVVVDEMWRTGSFAAEVSARIMEGAFYELDAPVARVCTAEVPIPYAQQLEQAALPSAAGIADAVRAMGAAVGEFRMPSLGADMTQGRLVEWLVRPGEVVHRGDIVAVVDTSKAEIDVEIFEDGVIGELLVEEGELVPVGTVLATVGAGAPSAAPAAPVRAPTAPLTPTAPPATIPPPVPTAPPAAPVLPPAGAANGRVHASPIARRMAEQLGVDLTTLVGTGPHGAICKADVERAAAPPASERPPAPAPPPERPPHPAPPEGPPAPVPPPPRAPADTHQEAMRQTIAALMARSKREIPHYYLTQDIDMSRALAWLERHNMEVPIAERLLPAALLLAATARATREFPDFNGFCDDGVRRASERVHLGVAIAMRGGGLIAPAILDADRMTPPELMDALRDLVARTRRGGLRGSELSEPTITVTSLGDQGVTSVLGVIYPPQVALVGFGRVRERPWAEGGMVGARPLVTATLAADHRVSDGHRGGLFLAAIDSDLQRPEEL